MSKAWQAAALTAATPAGLAQATRPGRPPGQGRAEDPALPHPARRRPARFTVVGALCVIDLHLRVHGHSQGVVISHHAVVNFLAAMARRGPDGCGRPDARAGPPALAGLIGTTGTTVMQVDWDATDLSAADFGNGTGTVHVEGNMILNHDPSAASPTSTWPPSRRGSRQAPGERGEPSRWVRWVQLPHRST
jgi:hypothetical protein